MTSPEFEQLQYPKRLSCQALPEFEPGSIEIKVTNWCKDELLMHVPTAAVRRIHMPRLSPAISEDIHQIFDRGMGLALVACRILNTHEDLFSVALPSLPEPSTLVIKQSQLARRM